MATIDEISSKAHVRSAKSVRKWPHFAGNDSSILRFRHYWHLKLFTALCDSDCVWKRWSCPRRHRSQFRQLHSDEFFFQTVAGRVAECGLKDITLPRHENSTAPSLYRRVTERAGQMNAPSRIYMSAEECQKVQFYAFLDASVQHITDRFVQSGLNTYSKLESLLLSHCRGDDYLTCSPKFVTFLMTLTKIASNFSCLR
jgi:hypothetical protein